MLVIIAGIVDVGGAVLFLLAAILCVEVLLAVVTRIVSNPSVGFPIRTGDCIVIVPAHNEGANLVPTLRDIRRQLSKGDRLVVVADNCDDDTARVASREGAEVIERNDPERRGKGYALECGVDYLRSDPPATVIIVDADCRFGDHVLSRLCEASQSAARPAQGLYLMLSGKNAPPNIKVAEFAWLLKNWVRPLGLRAAGLPCQLMGSGMAFPWSVIAAANLGTAHVVEDMKLGIELAASGSAPVFCPGALVTSQFPVSDKAIEEQRKRWEQGHLSLLVTATPLALKAALARNWDLLALLLDLAVPPLSMLIVGLALMTCGSLLLYGFGGYVAPLWLGAGGDFALVAAIALSWMVFGRDVLPIREAPAILSYLRKKLPLYSRIWRDRRGIRWTRTERDEPNL